MFNLLLEVGLRGDQMKVAALILGILAGLPAAEAADIVPLRHGAYVKKEVSCANASDSVLMSFNGSYFSAGHMPDVTVKRDGNTWRVEAAFSISWLATIRRSGTAPRRQ